MAKLILRDLQTTASPTTGASEKKNTFLVGAEVDQNFLNLNAEVATKAPINNPTFTGEVIITDGIIDGANIGLSVPGSAKFTATEVNRTDATLVTDYSLHVKSSTNNAGRAVFSQGSTYGMAISQSDTNTETASTKFQWINLASGAVQSTPITINYDGSVTFASSIVANGAAITHLNASQLDAGTVPSGRLSGTYSISVTGNAGTVTNGVYTNGTYANPVWITSLNSAKLTGTVSGTQGTTSGSGVSSFVVYSGVTTTAGQFNGGSTLPTSTTRLNYDGYLYATRFYGVFYGNGIGITNLNASQLDAGTVPAERLNGTYTITVNGNASTSTVAGNVSGVVAIENGGTGATTAAAARTSLGATATGSAIFTASEPRNVVSFLNQGTYIRETNGGSMVSNAHYSIWTGGGVIAMNIPEVAATAVGDRILVTNMLGTWGSNAFTVTRVGNTFIGGLAENMICDVNVQGFELVCSHKTGTAAYWNVFVF